MGIQSLHSHTFASDGQMTNIQALDLAKKHNIEVIAFTEHDVLPDQKKIEELKALNHPTKWLIGIEVSSGLPKELGGGKYGGLHVLGLFIDPTNKDLLDYCRKSQEERVTRMQMIVKNFQNLGFDITEADCRAATTGESIGQPHIVKALTSKHENIALMTKYAEEMKKAGENDPKIAAEYELMVEQGEYQYPYVLFLGDGAFKEVGVPAQYWLDFDSTIALIRGAGGIASIAHYTTAKTKITTEILEDFMKNDRLDALETVYGFWGYGNSEEKIIEADRKLCRDLITKYDKLATGGGDTHREEDIINFAKNKWYSDETKGMVEKIITKKDPNLSWSNF